MTLYRGENEEENLIAYRNYLADQMLRLFFPTVIRKHMKGIQMGSSKLIELFYKKFCMLARDKQEITVNGVAASPEERTQQLAVRLAT